MPLPCVVEMSDIRTKSVLMKKSNYNSEKFVRSFPFPAINTHSLENDYSSRDTRLFGSEIVISVKAIISHLLPDSSNQCTKTLLQNIYAFGLFLHSNDVIIV